ncbi:MAG: dual specificity protein phosphatase family protein [Acidobacteriota bacterium]
MRIDWIRTGLLAGAPRPGLLDPLADDVDQLRRFGFEVVLNLTETPIDLGDDADDLEVVHFPIVDMGVPMPDAVEELCRDLWRRIDAGTPVLVHCKAGLGRTGTILACMLVYRGAAPEDATTEVRLVNSRFIQNQIQEHFVRRFADFLGKADT